MAEAIDEAMVAEEEALVDDQIDEIDLEVLVRATTIHPAIQIEVEIANGTNQKEQVNSTIEDHLAERKDLETDLKEAAEDTTIMLALHQE